MQITVKLFIVLLAFSGVLLSGCSPTLHPTITVTSTDGGISFAIFGQEFSSGTPCADLSYDPPSGLTRIQANVPCKGGKFNIVTWTPAQVPGCTANTPVTVVAVDHKTATPTGAPVSILCEAALCPDSFTKATLPSSMQTYFTSGFSVSGGNYSAGPTGLANAWADSNCVPLFIFKLKSSSQAGGVETCTYKATTCSAKSGPGCSDCTSVVNAQKMTLVFTCPDTGDCTK
jgi:hypothetical protein